MTVKLDPVFPVMRSSFSSYHREHMDCGSFGVLVVSNVHSGDGTVIWF